MLNIQNIQTHHRRWTLRHDHSYCKVISLWSVLRDHNYCRFFTFKKDDFVINFIKLKNRSLHNFDCKSQLHKYSCKRCKFKTYFVTSLVQHFLDFHNSDPTQRLKSYSLERIYTCDGCAFQTRSLLVWMKHEKECTKEPVLNCVYCCNRCLYVCDSLHELEAHQLCRHLTLSFPSYEKYTCDLCAFTAVSESGLRTHKSVTHRIQKTKAGKKVELNQKPKFTMQRYLVHDPIASTVQWYKCASCTFKSEQPSKVRTHFCLKNKKRQ